MKRLLTCLMLVLLVMPLVGCDVDDFFDDVEDFVDDIEDFFEDLDDDDHDHGFGGITIIIGGR